MTLNLYTVDFDAMGSRCLCKLAAQSEAQAQQLAAPAIAEVRRIEYKYSRYRKDSLLSEINAAAGKHGVTIDAETSELLRYADTLFHASDGLFDISSGLLRRAWNFQVPQLPSESVLAPLLKKIGWQKIGFDAHTIFLPEAGMEIDFGGFGKEYAVDRAATILLEQGVRSGVVDLGGDVRILGPQPNGEAWMIGIADPRQQGQVCASLPVSVGALATSGDYERYFEMDGERYCHILHPQTGYPVRYWRSVSVLAPVCIAAGSYTTIAMLKEKQARTWLAESGLACLLIDAEGQTISINQA